MRRVLSLFSLLLLATAVRGQNQTPEPRQQYLAFIRAKAAALRAQDQAPQSRAEWDRRRGALRAELLRAWGGFPETPCPLQPRILGTLKRDGYRIEKLIFQTRPGVWMTANAYVPDGPGKHPALLAVHGHWRGARLDPVVQSRCIGACKLGFFVLAVDAFGAGERGVGTKLGEYHGSMTAATLLPIGLPLSGLQVYENLRAVDYLRSRPEVDARKIGVSGASGGGNQTMYAGAWDERLGAAVPVCSVGNYQAYLGAACCLCEVVPGALRFTEEGDMLGLTAPRGLLVINASKDARQFSPAEAKKSFARAAVIYRLLERSENVRHTIFESGHDYSKPMREAMYGWMARHLQGKGDGRPIAEPTFKTENPEALRCYPGDSRPADWVTLPRFAAAEGRKLLAEVQPPASARTWETEARRRRQSLLDQVIGGLPQRSPLDLKVKANADRDEQTLTFHPEPGLTLTARKRPGTKPSRDVAILLDLDGAAAAEAHPLADALRKAGWTLVTLDLRATGKLTPPGDSIAGAPDHNSAEWALWIGRPLLGQWTNDVRRLLDALGSSEKLPRRVAVVGHGPAGLVALAAGATDKRITHVATVNTLASYISEVPYREQRLGVMAPSIVRHVGDVPQLAALCAPRRVVIAGGLRGDGKRLAPDERNAAFAFTRTVWQRLDADNELRLIPANAADVVQALR